jgi:putative sigma-54 modulation protein
MSRKSKAAEFIQDEYDITVTGRNVMVTDAMKDYALEKVAKMERFASRIIDAEVVMDIQKLEHRVEIIVKVNNIRIVSRACTDNMYASIDKAVDKLESQLRRYKKRIQEHQARTHAELEMDVSVLRPAEDELNVVNDEIESENRRRLFDKYRPHHIVKHEKKLMKTLTDGEALMKMELSGDHLMIYQGEEDLKTKVIYRRDDGDFDVIVIEP